MVRSAGDEQYAGCTGFPADSHNVIWLTVRPFQLQPAYDGGAKPPLLTHCSPR